MSFYPRNPAEIRTHSCNFLPSKGIPSTGTLATGSKPRFDCYNSNHGMMAVHDKCYMTCPFIQQCTDTRIPECAQEMPGNLLTCDIFLYIFYRGARLANASCLLGWSLKGDYFFLTYIQTTSHTIQTIVQCKLQDITNYRILQTTRQCKLVYKTN